MIELGLLLLLPVAMYSGWWFARTLEKRSSNKSRQLFSNQYFQGLNYLLNEQPDKAIQVFLELAEVNKDTVETHMALGSLFRRRGEVDRAIRFHQNIIAKPGLEPEQRTQALLELGEDYMRAGLLDRAERLFAELIETGAHTPSALRSLLDIYQQEKDWKNALEQAQRLEQVSGEHMGDVMAQFCCEMAEAALAEGDHGRCETAIAAGTGDTIRAASVRASSWRESSHREDDHAAAMDLLRGNRRTGYGLHPGTAGSIPGLLRPVAVNCTEAAQKLDEWSESYNGISLILKLTEFIAADRGRCGSRPVPGRDADLKALGARPGSPDRPES